MLCLKKKHIKLKITIHNHYDLIVIITKNSVIEYILSYYNL